MRRLLPLVFVPPALALEPLVVDTPLADDGTQFVLVPFDVPDGVAEIEVHHDDGSDRNVIDFGLLGPNGFRGWGGGNSEPAVVGERSASRSYLTGPMPGRWQAILGKALLSELPASHRLEVRFHEEPTLPVDPDRGVFEGAAVLSNEARWYAGDFHVHSKESGDARPDLDEIATFAKGRGLDFVLLSEHNTVSHLDFIDAVQARHPDLLLVPGMEFTTYSGHANVVGATGYASHLLGVDQPSVDEAARAFAAQGAVLSINHPVLNLGDACLGCAWEHDVDPTLVGGVEIATGGWAEVGFLFTVDAIAFWDDLLDRGSRATPLGGSDDHRAGVNLGAFGSPIGSPTTLVFATELSWKAITRAVREGRTVVKLQGPDDPMVTLEANDARIGDTLRLVEGETATLKAIVTGGEGRSVRFVRDGAAGELVDVTSDPFVLERAITSSTKPERWRAEVFVDDHPTTVTGHLWVERDEAEEGCGCGAATSMWLLLALLARRRR